MRGRRSRSIDVAAARAHPGVVAVYTGEDIGDLDREMPLLIPHPSMKDARTQRPLARGDVYYVGQTVAMVVAVDRYTAEDAAALVEVDYDAAAGRDRHRGGGEARRAARPRHASRTTSPRISSRSPASRTTPSRRPSTSPRSGCRSSARPRRRWSAARSPRVCDAVTGELTVWDGTQAPISVRGGLASIFGLDEDKVRVIAPNVGGGFGQKVLLFYPDELLVPMAAMQLGRPVKYIEDRRENFIGSSQERTQIHYDRALRARRPAR